MSGIILFIYKKKYILISISYQILSYLIVNKYNTNKA